MNQSRTAAAVERLAAAYRLVAHQSALDYSVIAKDIEDAIEELNGNVVQRQDEINRLDHQIHELSGKCAELHEAKEALEVDLAFHTRQLRAIRAWAETGVKEASRIPTLTVDELCAAAYIHVALCASIVALTYDDPDTLEAAESVA